MIASVVWAALGDVAHYIEPFFGSGAVLLNRPGYDPTRHTESVCDKDGFVANVWRAIQFSPEETAKWSDWPVNHADLCVRRAALIKNEGRLLENLIADDRWHDPVMAGYWIWAASCWIGSGLTRPNARPHLGDTGKGVHAIGKRPHLSDAGEGVHAIGQRPNLGNTGTGVHAARNENIYRWFGELSARLRYVRVVCGDWTRVCGGNWQDHSGICGMFFDPPYSVSDRDSGIYHQESLTVAQDVGAWCRERGENPRYRIVLAGYEDEHDLPGWRVHKWKAQGGYGNQGKGPGMENRHREQLWISPHCFPTEQWQAGQMSLLKNV